MRPGRSRSPGAAAMTAPEPWERRLGDSRAALYPIGVVAEVLEVSVQVVRRYDDRALVQPRRTPGGQRRYSRRDIDRLSRAIDLAAEGIPLAGVKRILALEDEVAALRAELGDP